MQQPHEMMSPPLPLNITTEQIQKCLEENKQLIMAILESQNLGKTAECAMYQNQLQNNLTYLARIADCQPQAPKVPAQMLPQPSMQEEQYMQPSQAAQQGFLAPKLPYSLNDQQQQQLAYLQQQQFIQAQMGMRPGAPTGIYQAMQSGPGNSFLTMQGGSRQDGGSEGGAGDGLGR